ncbi:inhibitor of growth protein 4-like, partial [Rana temporaria]|uniref:inhibitor of growth protein 4-like n=1 Tax=Rana temporaria TaxID=8407 RepID=UPI001AAD92F0
MAAGMYLEHYLDSIENLPFELQRNFQLMRDLDQRTEDLKCQIDRLSSQYMSNARTLSSEEKLQLLRQVQEAYGKCKEYGDDKVQLAMQTYEMVSDGGMALCMYHPPTGAQESRSSTKVHTHIQKKIIIKDEETKSMRKPN